MLLSGREEREINEFFIESAFPTREEVGAVLAALEQAPQGLSASELLGRINVREGRVQKALLLLSLESPAPIAKQGSKWQLTVAPLDGSFWERAERLTALRREERQQMEPARNELTDSPVQDAFPAQTGTPIRAASQRGTSWRACQDGVWGRSPQKKHCPPSSEGEERT